MQARAGRGDGQGPTRREEDLALAELAVERGLITPEGAREAIEAGADLAEIGRAVSLGQILVRRRAIDVETYVALAREVRERGVRCAFCRAFVLGPPPGAGAGAACPKCGDTLRRAAFPSPASYSSRSRGEGPPPPLAPPAPETPVTPVFGQPLAAGEAAGRKNSTSARKPPPAPGETETVRGPGEATARPASPPAPPPGRGPVRKRGEIDPDHLAGRRFGRYDVLSEIARGGMGVVYRARDAQTGRIVALKVLKDGVAASEKQVRRFKRETEAVAKLHHPNIVAVHDVGCVDGRHYFTMDYVDGEPLDMVIRRGPVEPSRALLIAEMVARAMHHAHERGIIHRDLKPANVILDGRGVPKITDFGLAKNVDHVSAMTKTGAAVGTPFYMPPEQARGDAKRIDRRVDVYAIGVILYEMLTGELPFDGETTLEVYQKILQNQAPRPSAINRAVDADTDRIVLKAMAKERDDRYATALELAEDIRRKLEGQPIRARPPGAVAIAARRARRAAPIFAIAAAALALVGVAVFLVHRIGEKRHEEELRAAAAREIDTLKERARRARDDAERCLRRAERLRGEGRLSEARRAVEEALALLSSPEAWLLDLRYRDRVDQAARAVIAEFSGGEAKALLCDLNLERGRVLALAGDPAAGGAFDAALALDPKNEQARLARARWLADAGRATEALRELDALAAERPDLAEARFERGRAHEARRDFKAAIEDYGAVAARERARAEAAGGIQYISPASGEPTLLARAIVRLAACEAALGRREEALRELKTITDADGSHFPAFVLGSEIRLRMGRVREALKDAEAAIQANGDRPEGYAARGRVALALGEYERALKDFDEALGRDRGFVGARLGRALVHERRGALRAAEEEYEAAIGAADSLQQGPGAREARVAAACAWARIGDLRRTGAGAREERLSLALEAYDRAIDLDPGLGAAYVARARARLVAGRLDDAAADLEAAESARADPAPLENARGLLALARGNAEEAALHFEKALDAAFGLFPEAAANRGEALEKLGRTGEARRAYAYALVLEARAGKIDLAELGVDAGGEQGAVLAGLLADPARLSAWPDAEAALFYMLGARARGRAGPGPGRGPGAADFFARAGAIAPRFARAHYELARLRREAGALDEALAAAAAAVSANPCFVEAIVLRGSARTDLAIRRGPSSGEARELFVAARADFEAALGIEPGRIDARLGLARAQLFAGEPAKAKKEVDAAIDALAGESGEERAPERVALHVSAYELAAEISRALGRGEDAAGYRRAAEELRRRNRGLAIEKLREGMKLHGETRYAEAVEKFTAAIEADTSYAEAWVARSASRFQLGDRLGSARDSVRAIEIDPRLADRIFDQVTASALAFDTRAFAAEVEAAIAASPDDVQCLFIRAITGLVRVYFGQAQPGEDERSIADLDKVLRALPRHTVALVARAYLKARRDDLDGAGADAALAEKIEPRLSLAPFVGAIVAARKGDAGGAAAGLERAIARGFRSAGAVRREKAFEAVAGDARFKAAVARLEGE